MTKSITASSKARLLAHVKLLIQERITDSESAVEAIRESRDSDSKSTAGDKHEVGRAMVQIELDNQSAQLAKNILLLEQLETIQLDRNCTEVGFGNLVLTNAGSFFISIGLGKVDLEETTYYVISRESPIGQMMEGQRPGKEFTFNDRVYTITAIS